MAKQRRAGRRESGTGTGGGRVVLGLMVVAVIATGGFLLYRHTAPYQGSGAAGPERAVWKVTPEQGTAPAMTASGPASRSAAAGSEAGGVAPPTAARAEPPLPQAPFGESEEVFETGARVYVAHCASCHGRPGHPAQAAAVQLWDPHAAPVERLVARPPGAIYEQIAGGVDAASGMPAMAGYRHVLSETEMWDLVLLLRNARQELPDPVLHLLAGARP